MVGAGVVNLVSAWFLAKRGYHLVIIDKAPPPEDRNNWQQYGCTFGGENVRMFSYTEADNYNEKGSQLYSRMDRAFKKVINEGGWLVRDQSDFSALEKAWIEDYHHVSAEDAQSFEEDIYQCNMASGKLWNQWIMQEPALFAHTEVREGIVRLYSDAEDYQAARSLHGRLGSMIREIPEEEICEKLPVFQHALNSGRLGGCLLAEGFTLKVHDFCKNLLTELEAIGAEIRWDTCFSGIEKTIDGKVKGIVLDGKTETFDHYILSLGAFAGSTLLNTGTHNQLHGMLGVWLTLPNPYPELNCSMKIHKTGHVGEDTNVTLISENGSPVLVLGSGYGYTGNATRNEIEVNDLQGIYDSVVETAQVYFPEAYKAAAGTLKDQSGKYCVRSWTPTGLGVFERIPTQQDGQLIITGGNNTGGFTQAPHIAEAVVAALEGQHHPMHDFFHPGRLKQAAPFSI